MSHPVSEQPKVSIITPTYNRVHYLEETLANLFKLNYENWEWIIIDDGSTDATEDFILRSSRNKKKIRYFKRSKDHLKGPSGCRNHGIDLARGKFIVFVDDDDIVHPDLLNITTKILIENPGASYCRYDKRPFTGLWDRGLLLKTKKEDLYSIFKKEDIPRMITGEVPFACCTVMWKKEDLDGERFHEDLSYAEEWEFYNRLIIKNNFGISLRRILYYNRKHQHSNTGQFWANNPIRRRSKVEASLLVIKVLKENNFISSRIFKYFIQLGFFLKSRLVLNEILNSSKVSKFTKLKYKAGFNFYPILRPLFRFKGRLKKYLNSRGS